MSEINWSRVREIMAGADGLQGNELARYLDDQCHGDPELRRQVESLLEVRPTDALGTGVALIAGLNLMASRQAGGQAPAGQEMIGTVIGGYEILESKGTGGFSRVYAALQRSPLQRKVAMKVITSGLDAGAFAGRFEFEKQALAGMDHPGIAKVFDAGTTPDGLPFLVMELVEGVAITTHCDQERATVRERLELFLQVCEAVQHAHGRGLIHRDIKPANVLAFKAGGKHCVKVIDFGIARAIDRVGEERVTFTAQGLLLGTPAYMSPEQAAGDKTIDVRSDVYSMGVLLYELLCGQLPFDVERLRSQAYRRMLEIIELEEPPKPSDRFEHSTGRGANFAAAGARTTASDPRTRSLEIARQRGTSPRALSGVLRGDLDWLVMKALDKDPKRRYQTMEAFADDVRRYLAHEALVAGPPTRSYRVRKFVRRHRLATAVSLIVAASMLGGLGLMQYGLSEARAGRAEAQRQTELAVRERDLSKESYRYLVSVFRSAGPLLAGGKDATLIIELMEQSLRDLDAGGMAGNPRAEVWLRVAIGQVLHQLARFEEAEANFERAEPLAREAFVGDSEELAEIWNCQGMIKSEQGRIDASIPFFEKSLAMMKRIQPPGDRKLTHLMSNLAINLGRVGRTDEQAALLSEVLEIRKAARVQDPQNYALGLVNLSVARADQGKLEEAKVLLREAVEIYESLGETSRADLGAALSNLAGVLRLMQKHDEALVVAQRALSVNQEVYKSDHPATAASWTLLGILQRKTGHPDEGERSMKTGIEMHQRIRKGDHPDIALAFTNLANCQAAQAHFEEAIASAKAAVAMARRLEPSGGRLTSHCAQFLEDVEKNAAAKK